VAEEWIANAVGQEPVDAVMERAVRLLERSGTGAGSDRERARGLSLLVRRGFPLEMAYDAIRELQRNG